MVRRIVALWCAAAVLAAAGAGLCDDGASQEKPTKPDKVVDKALKEKPAIGSPKKDSPQDWVAQRANSLKEKLGLSDEQGEKVKEILASEQEQMKALKADTTLSEEQRKERAKEIARSANEAILSILTPEQRALMQEKSGKGGGEKKPKEKVDAKQG